MPDSVPAVTTKIQKTIEIEKESGYARAQVQVARRHFE